MRKLNLFQVSYKFFVQTEKSKKFGVFEVVFFKDRGDVFFWGYIVPNLDVTKRTMFDKRTGDYSEDAAEFILLEYLDKNYPND